jgi:phosphoribosylanthranilate isomerase
VFVNEDFEFIMKRVDRCGLSTVQLHGQESSALAARLKAEGVGVIKALFVDGRPGLDNAADYHVDGYLVECAKGPLPGGNAMAWDWGAAAYVGRRYPLILAGGLCEDNVTDAIAACRPAAVDVSSGVEASPGRKDARRVSKFIEAVQSSASDYDNQVIPLVFISERHHRHA